MVPVNPWTEQTLEILYRIFQRDFKDTQPDYRGFTVWFFPDREEGKEVLFWHMTSETDPETGQRLPDLRRCERLPWARPMLDHSWEPEIQAFDYREHDGDIHTYVWLKDHDYLVLMKKYKDGRRRLITSFYIKYPHYRHKLEKKFRQRLS